MNLNLKLLIGIRPMKKTILAIAVPAALLSNAASAVELYKDDVNTFSVGGHVSAGITGSDEGHTEVNSVSPRINIEATRDLGNGYVVDAKAEWGVNFLEGGENSFNTRLGYIGLTHEELGRAVVGTQWSPYYDVAGVADMPIAFANDFLYADQGNIGTARADKMVSYRNGFEFGNAGALNFGLGWQGAHNVKNENDEMGNPVGNTNYGNRAQATLSYSLMGATLGYAYNTGTVSYKSAASEDATTQAVSLSYGSYGQGFYAAGVFAQNENVLDTSFVSDEPYAKTNNTEILVAYALANSLNFSLNYEAVEDEGGNEGTLLSQSAVQVEYNFLPNTVGYVGYQMDLGSDAVNHKDDNVWMIGARIYL